MVDDEATGAAPATTGPLSPAIANRLPAAYAAALEAIDAGIGDEELAERIGIDVAAVPAMVQLARAKRLELERECQGSRRDDRDDQQPPPPR